MNFRPKHQEEPEINLIPFIDVLLVVLIFLMLSTTYSKFTELQVKLPVADTDAQRDYAKELIIAVGADGSYSINHQRVDRRRQGCQRHRHHHQCRCQCQAPVGCNGHGSRAARRFESNHVCNAVLGTSR